jgi:hypothetical protein
MFNRSEIMKTAWKKFDRFDITFAQALRMAWYEAKKAVPKYVVYSEQLFNGKRLVLASGINYEKACMLKEHLQYRYDIIDIVAA